MLVVIIAGAANKVLQWCHMPPGKMAQACIPVLFGRVYNECRPVASILHQPLQGPPACRSLRAAGSRVCPGPQLAPAHSLPGGLFQRIAALQPALLQGEVQCGDREAGWEVTWQSREFSRFAGIVTSPQGRSCIVIYCLI